MQHQIARQLLERAETFVERQEAVRTAMHVGIPLSEIEEILDWLDCLRSMLEKDGRRLKARGMKN